MKFRILSLIALLALALALLAPPAFAQGPQPGSGSSSTTDIVLRLFLDTLQGKVTPNADALFNQSRQSAESLLNQPGTDLFFLDFGDPNLPLNQFAAGVARVLLALTPLYAFAYLGFLIYAVWREKPIPNLILYAVLVAGVMVFLAAFAVITQGVSQLGRATALALGGSGGTLLGLIEQVLAALQQNGAPLSVLALLAAIVEAAIILVQLAYRGISMAIWRLLGVLLIPASVLVEGAKPRTAGRVIGGFFEAWLDMTGKMALLLIVLALASGGALRSWAWFVLPAGLLVVVLSWKFLGVLFVMVRDAVGRAWGDVEPAAGPETMPLPASAEVAQAQQIDADRRRLVEE